ncbi:MAG: hypothetical protein HFE36_03905 [Clostridia bacterium]|nr:hypothetical protein [Clostridia bacterium]
MKKKLIVLLVVLCMALGAGTTLTAFAGVNQNSPTGDGLMTGGGLNTTNYSLRGDSEPSAYSYKSGNTTYRIDKTTSVIGAVKPVEKEQFTKDKIFVLQFDLHDWSADWNQSIAITPFATAIGTNDSDCLMQFRVSTASTVMQILPAGAEVFIGGNKVESPLIPDGIQFGFDAATAQSHKTSGRDYVTYWLEYKVASVDSTSLGLSLTVYLGHDNHSGTVDRTEYATVNFSMPMPTAKKVCTLQTSNGVFEFDNWEFYEMTPADSGEEITYTKGTVYSTCDFQNQDKVFNDGTGLGEQADCLIITGNSKNECLKTFDTVVTVTNPNKDARIVSNNALAVDNRLEKTFEMQAAFKLVNFGNESTRKVGVALGLNDYRAVLSAPKNGASFIYLTENEEGQIVLGADNIAEDGTATAAGAQTVINGAELNATISLNITGKKDGSVDVTVGEQTVNFKDIKANGNVAIAQTGEGEVTFSVLANDFKVTGYQLTENEGEKVTSSFNGNWTSPAKFFFRNNIAPSAHVTAVEGGHAVTGMTPENGKVGFYGTSTNTALTFLKPYADFVMQFDYISVPYKQRGKLGGIETGGDANRFSPLYAVFGGESGESAIAEYYALGIVEGNATQYFWGAESLIAPEGKLLREGATLGVVSGVTDTEDSETAIPKYGANPVEGGKPAFTVNGYIKPADEEKSFYNKTTRFKLVVINNNVALWAANVDENGAVAGDYRKVYECTVKNSFGYVGFITDSPAWCELDNIAITPISTQTALDKGLNAEPAADLVADVPVSEMAADPMPEMLAKPVLTADTAAKKVTWNAIEGAGEYAVTVRFNGEEVDSKTVTATEYDMSKYTDKGDYTVSVVAIPADLEAYQKSLNANITYTVSDDGNEPGGNEPGGNETNEPDEGCGCGGSVNGALGSAAIVLILGGVAILIRRRKA